jgi:YHS domain-containing protein
MLKIMKRTLLKIAAVVLLAGSPALAHASDTNSPSNSTNAVVKPYPLDYCIVSGDKLDEHGKPIVIRYHGQEIKFCCADCVPEFKKDPATYLKKIQDAEKKAKP